VSSDSVNNGKLNRRAMVLGAVFLVGGAAALTRFSRQTRGDSAARGPVLAANQFALLEQVTDIIIPATDTPGAIGAGVPEFIRELLNEWGNAESRAEIASVLERVEQRSWKMHGAAFLELPAGPRVEILRAMDAESIAAHDKAYRKFKYLVLLGYYHSQIGATQELRYELVPGAWRACVPLTEIGRAAATWS
jgi:gluconate 2-dehydrogenase gamma chain